MAGGLGDCSRLLMGGERAEIVEEFWGASECCLPIGFSRQVRRVAVSKESFLDNLVDWKWLFLMSAMTLKLTVAGVERRHATHRQIAHPQMPFHLFAADSVLCEARHQNMSLERMMHEREVRRLEHLLPAVQDSSGHSAKRKGKTSQPTKSSSSRLRSPSVWDIFKQDWFRQQKEAGIRRWPGDPATWNACRQDFEALSESARKSLQDRSDALGVAVEMTLLPLLLSYVMMDQSFRW